MKKLLALAGLAALAFWILTHPDNFLTRRFQSKITSLDSHVVVGPYPLESDFPVLKSHGVTTLVILLDPRLPYERVLLAREMELARKHGLTALNFPMASVLGRRLGRDYQLQAERAAEAAARSPGKVYLNCYLGVHRVKVVADLLKARENSVGRYLLRPFERSPEERALDRAQEEFDAGRYESCLGRLGKIGRPGLRGRLLEAWARYRLGQAPAARSLFQKIAEESPGNKGALSGLGYCALRANELGSAERRFAEILRLDAGDPGALVGMGLVRYRQGRLEESADLLGRSLKIDPENREAAELLQKIRPRPQRPLKSPL